ncbi:hypothetical protein PoB_004333600, partial [Plakobranchus ocellatus]
GTASRIPTTPEVKVPSPIKCSSNPDQARASGSVVESQNSGALDKVDSINHAIERVLKMNSKQQKQLLQALNHIDIDDTGLVESAQAIASQWVRM